MDNCFSSDIMCIRDTGYSGKSVWGYPVDSQGNNCTNYAAYRLSKNGATNPGNLGNAGQWASNARDKGIVVNQTPAVGSIAQWDSGSAYAPDFGHVAYVEGVDASTIHLSDSNWKLGSKRWTVRRGDPRWPSNFIHITDVHKKAGPAGGGPELVIGRDHYWVWRGGNQANCRRVHQAAQQFTATLPYIDSISVNIGKTSGTGEKVVIGVYSDAHQKDVVPGARRVLPVHRYGQTIVRYDEPLHVKVGKRYYLQLIHPGGTGSFDVYHSKYDDDRKGAASLDWSPFDKPDLNAHVTGH